MNEKNTLFCINFVINSVIKFQETSFNLLALHKPYKLKIKTEIADVFSIEEGKLKKTSYIHCHSIFTVEKNLILKKVGKLKPEKLIEVKNIIKKVFNI